MLKRLCIVIGWVLAFTFIPYLAGTYLLPFIFDFDIKNVNILFVSILGLFLFIFLLVFISLLISSLKTIFYYIKNGTL